jgi:hypothetical protein
MTKVGTGFLRGEQSTGPATPQGRRIKAESNPHVIDVAFDSSSGIDRSARSLRRVGGPAQGSGIRNVESVTPLPPSAKAPRRTS